MFGVTTARSEKEDKQLAHRRLRRRVRCAMNRGDEALPLLREVSNVWAMAKDGRVYSPNRGSWAMRK
jgi:hypothetical protein